MLGHEYFAEVSEDFIEDDFNLCGLNQSFDYYDEALDKILDMEPGHLKFMLENENSKWSDISQIEASAEKYIV